MPIRAISFDLFDTLVDLHMDRLPLIHVAGKRMPSTYGLLHAASLHWHGLDFERFASTLGESDRVERAALADEQRELPTLTRFRAFAERISVRDDAMAHALTRTHMAEIRRQVTHLDHHAALLARLRSRFKLAVCSNFSHTPTAREVLADGGLLPHFDCVVISEEIGLRKPRVEIFRAVVERLGIPAHEILHVGDSLEADVGGAVALGMTPAWLTRRVRDRDAARRDHAGPAPALELHDLAELESALA